MKKYLILLLVLCLLLSMASPALAAEKPGAMAVDPPPDNILNIDNDERISEEILRGDYGILADDPPTQGAPLPYTAYAQIRSYTYTARYFLPDASGRFYTHLTGTIPNNCRVMITLYNRVGEFQTAYDYGTGTSFDKYVSWYNLNRTTFYYFKISLMEKVNSNDYFTFNYYIAETP